MPWLIPALKGAVLASVIGALIWIVDEIGDRREARVRAEIASEIAQANKRADEAERTWRAHFETQTAERTALIGEAAAEIKGKSGVFEPSQELLRKLNSINPGARR